MMYKSKIKKTRLVSLFLVFVMFFGIIPVSTMTTANAAGGVTLLVSEKASDDSAARQEGATYKTIQGAADAAQSGDTIQLSSNMTYLANVPGPGQNGGRMLDLVDKQLVFDLNGFTITCNTTNGYGFYCSGTAKLTVLDSSVKETGEVKMTSSSTAALFVAEDTAMIKVMNGTYDVNKTMSQTIARTYDQDSFIGLLGGTYKPEIIKGNTGGIYTKLNDDWGYGGVGGYIGIAPELMGKFKFYNYNVGYYFGEGKVQLTQDLDMPIVAAPGERIEVDLNGHSVTVASNTGNPYALRNNEHSRRENLYVYPQANLTLTNSANSTSMIENTYETNNIKNPTMINLGTLTLSGKLEINCQVRQFNYAPTPAIEMWSDRGATAAQLTVGNGVTINAPNTPGYIIYSDGAENSVVIEKGAVLNSNSWALCSVGKTLSITGGQFVSAVGTPIDIDKTTVTEISGATIQALGTPLNGAVRIQGLTAPFTMKNTLINRGESKGAFLPVNLAVKNESDKDITISGKYTYWVADTIYTAIGTGKLNIIGGVFSKDPDTENDDYVDNAKYAILTLSDSPARYLVAPWTRVGSDNKVTLSYATDATVASDAIDIEAIDDIEDVVSDPAFVTAKQFTLSSSADTYKAIPGLSVAEFSGNTLTVQKTKETMIPDNKAYVWYGGKSVGEIIFETNAKSNYEIIGSTSAGGSISPNGTTSLKAGDSKAFTITPNSGYQIADVLVDGVSVGAVSSYRFENVKANHTIEVIFKKTTQPQPPTTKPEQTPGNNPTDSKPVAPDDGFDKQKDDIKNDLVEKRDEAIAKLPDTLSDEQRKAAINELNKIFDNAIEALDKEKSANKVSNILNDALQEYRIIVEKFSEETPVSKPVNMQGSRPFILLSALLALGAGLLAMLAVFKKCSKKRKLLAILGAVAAILIFFVTTGWRGIVFANFWTLAVALATALPVFVCIMQRKEDEETKEDEPQ